MVDYKRIGLKIKENRKKLKLTQKELGEKIGKTESSIQKYEKGLTQIPNDVLEKLSEVFQISMYELIFKSVQNEDEFPIEEFEELIEKIDDNQLDELIDTINSKKNGKISIRRTFFFNNALDIKGSDLKFDEKKLNKIIEKQLISKELSNNLTQYFKAQNKEYNDEEIRDLIEQTFVFLEVITPRNHNKN